jgi:lipid-A-disaccharide synthase-like uncharacterized protein
MKNIDFEILQILIMFFIVAIGLAFAQQNTDNWYLWATAALFVIPHGRLVIRLFDYKKMAKPVLPYFIANEILVGVVVLLYFLLAQTIIF